MNDVYFWSIPLSTPYFVYAIRKDSGKTFNPHPTTNLVLKMSAFVSIAFIHAHITLGLLMEAGSKLGSDSKEK